MAPREAVPHTGPPSFSFPHWAPLLPEDSRLLALCSAGLGEMLPLPFSSSFHRPPEPPHRQSRMLPARS